MSARALSSASISFGLVSIPVKLYSTNQSTSGISFNMLHKECGSRLRQQYLCTKDGKVVSRDETVKGYEFAKDQYVIFSDEELKAIEEQSTKSIDIAEFVPASQVDPLYFEGAYYLGPDKGGERAYRLLVEAMKQSGQCAVAKHAARGKQYIVLVRAMGDVLVMQQLRGADEVKPVSEIPLAEAELKEPELKLAMQFVQALATNEFRPDKYEDVVKKRLQEIIQKKIEGQQVSLAPVEAPKGQIIDLMEALKASLAQKAGSTPEVAPVAPAARADGDDSARKPPKRAPRQAAAKEPKKARGSK